MTKISLSRATSRTTAKPRGPSCTALKRSCENGMLNSARQLSPSRVTTTSQTASQLSSELPSLNQYTSRLHACRIHRELVAGAPIVILESMITRSQSEELRPSRRVRKPTKREGVRVQRSATAT